MRKSRECDPYHIKMSVFQLFPQELLDKYVEPFVHGYLRKETAKRSLIQSFPDNIYHLILSFSC